MKKITKITAALLVAVIPLVSFSCKHNNNNIEENGKSEPPVEVIPDDAMRYWQSSSTATEWSVYGVEDLEKLAEVVNGGNALAGVTITQKKDIVINEKVLSDDFKEPAEGDEAGTPNPNLKNLDSIGTGKDVENDNPFSGTYDGQGKIISGLYMYQGHQGLGLFGFVEEAVIKNVILIDSCVINKNVKLGTRADDPHDSDDDDRFGGLIGVIGASEDSETPTEIINCLFAGVVGSKVAKDRGSPYEYIGGMVGRADADATAKDCFAFARIYGSHADAFCGRHKNSSTGYEYFPLTARDNVNGDGKGEEISDFDEDVAAEIAEAIKAVKANVQ